MKGLKLLTPQGVRIIEGKIKMVILSEKPPEDFYDTDIAIIEDEKILGTLRLKGEAGPLKPGTVRSPLRDLHGLTDEDWDERVEKDPKLNESVYTITFGDVKPWDEPTPYDESKVEGEYWVNIEVNLEGATTSDDVLREKPMEIIEDEENDEEIIEDTQLEEETPEEVLKKELSSGFITIDDDEVWNIINTWEKRYNFSEEGLKHLQNAHEFLQGQTSKFVIFALTTAKRGIELPNIPLNENWHMDEAAQLIIKSYTKFMEKVKSYRLYKIASVTKKEPILEDEISGIVESIMTRLESELRKIVKSELKKLTKD